MKIPHLILALAALLPCTDALADAYKVTTPRGAAIAVIAEKPTGSGPFPAVVLGSGSGYHMRQPVMEQTARALLEQGIAVYRLDWAYRVAGGEFAAQPKDRLAEIEDMTTVLDLARRDADIDKRRIAVGGKSLGSIIAWRVLRAAPDVKGALLLTPVCSRPETPDAAAANYPALADETRPFAWVPGDSDPACPTATLYRFVADAGSGAPIAVVGGDHSFDVDPARQDATLRSERNVETAARLAADFAAELLSAVHAPTRR